MKKMFCMFLSAVLLCSCSLTACIADETAEAVTDSEADLIIALQIGNPVMRVNGIEKEIDPGRGKTPILQNDRTLLPIRAVVEEMGGSVGWNEEAQEATLMLGEDTVRLTINNTTAYFNGETYMLDVAPVVINDRTMLPIRFIAERFQFDVAWDDAAQEIRITKKIEATADTPSVGDGNMVLINGGTYTMGSPENEAERDADEVQHEVTVDSFYMARTELTQEAYQAVMGSNPSENQGGDLPVENITWYDAIAYCNALSEAEGLTPCYTVTDSTVVWDRSADGYRLPTEAEWEYAARANTQAPFHFGD